MLRALVLSGSLFAASIARPAAASGPPLLLGVAGCGELDEREIRRLVAAELGTLAVEQHAPGVTLVTVRCGGLSVVIRVDDPLSRKTVERAFDTGPLDRRARARWIALAASELVLSSWAELETNPLPRVEPLGPPPPAPLRRAAEAAVRRRAPASATRGASIAGRFPVGAPRAPEAPQKPEESGPPFRVVGLVSVRSFFDGTGQLWGGGLRASEERFTRMSWSADFLVEAGTLESGRDSYEVRSGTFGAWLMLHHEASILTARIGAGLRMGVVAALRDGNGGNTESAVAPWGWPLAATSLTLGVGPAALEYSMEGGYVVLPIGGDTRPSVRGGWFSAQLGVGIRR